MLRAVRIIFITREEMPVNVWLRVAVARVVHLPGTESGDESLPGNHQLSKESGLNWRPKLMQFSNMIPEQEQAIAFMKLMVAQDENGMLEFVNEERIAPGARAPYTLANRT
jgi:hypothetical protein